MITDWLGRLPEGSDAPETAATRAPSEEDDEDESEDALSGCELPFKSIR